MVMGEIAFGTSWVGSWECKGSWPSAADLFIRFLFPRIKIPSWHFLLKGLQVYKQNTHPPLSAQVTFLPQATVVASQTHSGTARHNGRGMGGVGLQSRRLSLPVWKGCHPVDTTWDLRQNPRVCLFLLCHYDEQRENSTSNYFDLSIYSLNCLKSSFCLFFLQL